MRKRGGKLLNRNVAVNCEEVLKGDRGSIDGEGAKHNGVCAGTVTRTREGDTGRL